RRDELRGVRPGPFLDGAVDASGAAISPERLLREGALPSGAPEDRFVAGVRRPDGEHRWVAVNSAPVLGADGRPEGVVTTLGDITERRAAEQRLVASERATRILAAEQTALRRIATLVASDRTTRERCARHTADDGRLLGVPSVSLLRYGPDRQATVVATFTEPGTEGITPGATVALEGETVIARVYRS